MVKKYFVYKHTSPSGKIYIGITCQKLSQRWSNGKGYKSQPHFWAAICKYGWENIKHEILFEGLTKEQAEKKEIELIENCKSLNISYNITDGGHLAGGWHQSDEFKKKLSKLYTGEGNPQFGKHHSKEHKNKISMALKGRSRPNDVRQKISIGLKSKPKTINHRKSLSESIKGRKFIHKDGKLKQVPQEQLQQYIADGWTVGYIHRTGGIAASPRN